MKYPIILQKTNNNTVIAFCPTMYRIMAEGKDVDSALKTLREKFLCYLHDQDIQLEIMSLDSFKDWAVISDR
ncbi:MAG: hypothetical protein A2252_06005 [Elusimicrobia bacterium RIFOXYA2_FULL_39_19]|nr:MAG: hypothetical protein A2252_06005 [Elusimicrobia bacterium RIFOXYA2_FULL_39_19]